MHFVLMNLILFVSKVASLRNFSYLFFKFRQREAKFLLLKIIRELLVMLCINKKCVFSATNCPDNYLIDMQIKKRVYHYAATFPRNCYPLPNLNPPIEWGIKKSLMVLALCTNGQPITLESNKNEDLSCSQQHFEEEAIQCSALKIIHQNVTPFHSVFCKLCSGS